MQTFISRGSALTAVLSLVACGGGGSDTTNPPAPPPTSSGTAVACMPTAQFVAGYRHVLDYQSTETAPGRAPVNGTRRDESSLSGTVIVAGMTTTRMLQTDTYDGGAPEQSANYEAVDGTKLLNPRFDNLSGSTITGTNTTEPATYVDFGLTAGQSHTLNYVARYTNATAGTTITSAESETITFVGREDVSTPAGSFVGTCHFKIAYTVDGETTAADAWIAAGSGVLVRSTFKVAVTGGDYVYTETLVAGTVNGVPLRP